MEPVTSVPTIRILLILLLSFLAMGYELLALSLFLWLNTF
jgi:hypothetical protein